MTDSSTILIVDDIPANLEVICDTLSNAGYEIATAIDGYRALKRIQTHPPDLILLDVQMPGIDGLEVCRQLKADTTTTQIPVIFMTALGDMDSKVKGLDLGAVDYVTKPFHERELLARVKTHLQVSQLTKTLAKTVEERTTALNELRHTQLQMVQSEKMSALGQMVAGVAHEINNPINFINGNISYFNEYTQDLLRIIQAYQQHYPNPPKAITSLMTEIDLDFLSQDILQLLHSTQIGADRITEIVLSLRNFSRLDESSLKLVDLHEGIDSTLVILNHRLKATSDRFEISVICDYGDLPLVNCYAGQLNQVFMNLLSNAIDALEESQNPQKTIRIWTEAITTQTVAIHIVDNGEGISEELQSQIFNPFFTTKPVGKGTGLGLSISHQIVSERHGGKLWCNSTVGQGTELVIEVPMQGDNI